MNVFTQQSFPPLHENAVLIPLSDFVDTLSLLDAQKTDHERFVEVREDCPEFGTLAVRLMVRDQEDATADWNCPHVGEH